MGCVWERRFHSRNCSSLNFTCLFVWLFLTGHPEEILISSWHSLPFSAFQTGRRRNDCGLTSKSFWGIGERKGLKVCLVSALTKQNKIVMLCGGEKKEPKKVSWIFYNDSYPYSTQLDFCNMVYMGLSLKTTWKLQLVQHAGRLLANWWSLTG